MAQGYQSFISLQQQKELRGGGSQEWAAPFQFLLPYSPGDLLAPPHGTSPKSSWCMWLVGNPVYEPCTSGPYSRTPKWPTGTWTRNAWRVAHQPLPPSVSLSHQSPSQGSLPGLGHQPMVHEVPQRLVTSCICPSPSGPGPSRPGAAK